MPILKASPALLRQFRAGDRTACERVYWHYVGSIETIAWAAVTRGSNSTHRSQARRAEVADIVQDVFVKAFAERARLGYDGLRPYAPYLYAIARNVLVDWARARGREIPTEDGDLEAALHDAHEPGAHPYARPDTMKAVERFIRALPDDLRAIHEQRYVAGLSQRDAADALGLSRQTIRTLEGHLHRKMEEALRELEQEPPLVTPELKPSPGWRR
jgi:RNA polymerase sigma-70 factor (ECF subfamily)